MDHDARRDAEALDRLTREAARYLGVPPTHEDAIEIGGRLLRTLSDSKHWRDERLARASDR